MGNKEALYRKLVNGLRNFDYGETLTIYNAKGRKIKVDKNPKTFDQLKDLKKQLFQANVNKNRNAVPNRKRV
jgi:hypothetical protein